MSRQRKTMRAVVLQEQGGPEKLVIPKVDIPPPGPTDVLIKVQYCGIDGHDTGAPLRCSGDQFDQEREQA